MTPLEQPGDSPPLDSGLRCPACEYNLTGLAENRCPECGCAFDPDELRARLETAPRPIPVWGDRDKALLIRFAQVCLMTWFRPGRFGRTFPRRYDPASAGRFRLMVVLAAAAPLTILLVVQGGLSQVMWLGPSLGSLLICAVACERILGGLYNAYLLPDSPDKLALLEGSAPASWRGLVGMFRTFLILTILAGMVGMAWEAIGWVYGRLAMLAVALWWWVCLGRSMLVQPFAMYQRVVAVLLIPVVAIMSIVICIAAGTLLVALCGM